MKARVILLGLVAAVSVPTAWGAEVGVTILPWPEGMNSGQLFVPPLPYFPNPVVKMSRDGAFVAANADRQQQYVQVLRWNVATGVTDTFGDFNGRSYLGGLSTNGKTVGLTLWEDVWPYGFGSFPKTWTQNGGFANMTSPINHPLGRLSGLSNDAKTAIFNPDGGIQWIRDGALHLAPNGTYSHKARVLSGNGRFIFGLIFTSMFRYDITTGNILNIPTPFGVQWFPTGASDDGRTVTGFVVDSNSITAKFQAFRWNQTDGFTMLGGLFVTTGDPFSAGYACSQDGSIIVGTSALVGGAFNGGYGLQRGFYWTKETGMRSIDDVMGSQGVSLPQGYFVEKVMDVTVADGLVHVVGQARSIVSLEWVYFQARFLRPTTNGLPVDLNGVYVSPRNETTTVTTYRHPTYNGQQVFTPPNTTIVPFDNNARRPTPLRSVNLRGKGFQFDIDLGLPSRWPNLASDQIYQNGNAAEGKDGAAFIVKAVGPNGALPDFATDAGLRIAFYRRDGRFWAHVKNLWYNQDVDLPSDGQASRYRVKVAFATDGRFEVTLTQLGGDGVGTELSHHFAGGSVEGKGVGNASFFTRMVNKTSDEVAAPTVVRISNFSTNAVPNAMYLWHDRPFGMPSRFHSARLGVANLTKGISGYEALIQYQGNIQNYFGGQHNSLDIFNQDLSPLTLNPNTGVIAAYARSAGATSKLDRTLATLWSSDPPFTLAFEATEDPNWLYTDSETSFKPCLYGANRAWFDNVGPGTSHSLTQNGSPVGGAALNGPLDLLVWAADFPGHLGDVPTVSVDFGQDGTFEIRNQPLGSVNEGNAFRTRFIVPKLVSSARIVIRTVDNAGNEALITHNLSIDSGVTLRVRIAGIPFEEERDRAVRIILGNANGVFATIDKVLTFKSPTPGAQAEAIVTVGPNNGYTLSTPNDLTWVYIKDPYHTLGRRIDLAYANGAYGMATVPMHSGDLNNDNVVDVLDLLTFASREGAWVEENTAIPADSGSLLPYASRHPDLTGDQAVLDADLALIASKFGQKGNPEVFNGSIGAARQQVTLAQAIADGHGNVAAAIDVNQDGILTKAEILAYLG